MQQPQKVRISIGNIAMWVQAEELRGEPNPLRYFGIANPKMLKENVYEYQALGGAAMLTEAGQSRLESTYGAEKFERDQHTGICDARFFVSADRVEEVLFFFNNLSGISNPYEVDPTQDIIEELTGVEPGHPILVDPDARNFVATEYVDTVRQRPAEDGKGTSERGWGADVPTARLFRRYKLLMPPPFVEQLLSAPQVRELGEEELRSTRGGACKGRTHDGRTIRDNLFLL